MALDTYHPGAMRQIQFMDAGQAIELAAAERAAKFLMQEDVRQAKVELAETMHKYREVQIENHDNKRKLAEMTEMLAGYRMLQRRPWWHFWRRKT